MQELRANTEVIVTVGPFVDVGDGFTPQIDIDISTTDEAELMKHGATLAVDISGNTWAVATMAGPVTLRGYYSLTLTTTDTNAEGMLEVIIQDDSDCLPVKKDFMVLSEAAYDSKYVAKDDGFMDVNIKTLGRVDTQETEVNNLETICADYSATRGLAGTALPAVVAGAASGLPLKNASNFLNVANMPAVAAGGAGGLFIAGTNAETTVTTAINANLIGNITGNLSGSVGSLVAAGLQDIAQLINRTAGVVYHVKASGGADGNGLSWDDAYLHTTTSVKTVIEAASANDAVILGPGTFAMGANLLAVPDGVTVFGAGMDVTIITSTKDYDGPIVTPGSNTLIADLTVQGLGSEQKGAFGFGTGDGATGVVLRRVKGIANWDAVKIITTAKVTMTMEDCLWVSEYDGVFLQASHAESDIVLINNRIFCNSTQGTISGLRVISVGIAVRAYNLSIWAKTTGATARGIDIEGGTVIMSGGAIRSNSDTTPLDVRHYGGTLILLGVDYDRSKVSGTVTEISSAESAVVANKLDHLAAVAESDDPVDNSILAKMASTDGDWSKFVDTTDSLQSIRDVAPHGSAMVGTDNAALASVVGALADAAAAGNPTSADTLMQYAKQLVNILAGSAGIAAFPAEQAPANAVNLAEVIRAIHADVTGLNGSAMIGTNSAALASVCTEARLAVLTALTSAAAAKLALSAAGIVAGAVEAGTLSTTQMTTDLSEVTDDHYIGAVVVWTSGVLAGQRSDITDYTGADGLLTFTAVTEAPSATDTFVIL